MIFNICMMVLWFLSGLACLPVYWTINEWSDGVPVEIKGEDIVLCLLGIVIGPFNVPFIIIYFLSGAANKYQTKPIFTFSIKKIRNIFE